MPKKINPKNIVIMRTDRIGEVLLSTVAVEAIKKHYPMAGITFITSDYSRPIIEDRDDIVEVITVDTMEKGKWFKNAVWLAGLLRRRRFDISMVLNPHKMLHLACFLAGIPCRVGYDRKWGILLNKKIKDQRDKGQKHEIEYTLDLLQVLGIKEGTFVPRLFAKPEAEKAADRILLDRGITREKMLIAVHPGSSNPAKVWPGDKYAQLIHRITSELDCDVVILGSKKEKAQADDIVKNVSNTYMSSAAINLAGALDLKELAAFLKRCILFIGNDTGPMHMAAALGVPVIAIFRDSPGASNPKRWRPWGEGHVVFNEQAGTEVTLDEVFNAVKKTINYRLLTND